jgi:neutral amino acid transport system ATP-binding protein
MRVTASDPLLAVSEVRHAFDGLFAVNGVSLEVQRGSIVGLIGPNGAGKSTLVDVISGFKRLQSGEIYFEGQSIRRWAPYRIASRGLVRTFQVSTGFEQLTTLENLMVVTRDDTLRSLGRWLCRPASIGDWERMTVNRARDVLEQFGLSDQWNLYASELSGGQKRLLELARAVMFDPACILLDEPMAGVSPVLVEHLISVLAQLRDRGTTLLLVEHNLGVVERLCDDVFVLADGRVLAHGTMGEVRRTKEVIDAYLR